MRKSFIVGVAAIAAVGCTPAYTPLSYSTADIEPIVSCAKYVLPADVELLRKAGAWQIGRLETAQLTARGAGIIAQHGGTHFYSDARTLMAVRVPQDKMASLPAQMQPNRGPYPHGCTEDSFR